MPGLVKLQEGEVVVDGAEGRLLDHGRALEGRDPPREGHLQVPVDVRVDVDVDPHVLGALRDEDGDVGEPELFMQGVHVKGHHFPPLAGNHATLLREVDPLRADLRVLVHEGVLATKHPVIVLQIDGVNGDEAVLGVVLEDHDVQMRVSLDLLALEDELALHVIAPEPVLVKGHGRLEAFSRRNVLLAEGASLLQVVAEDVPQAIDVRGQQTRAAVDGVEEGPVDGQDELLAPDDAPVVGRDPHVGRVRRGDGGVGQRGVGLTRPDLDVSCASAQGDDGNIPQPVGPCFAPRTVDLVGQALARRAGARDWRDPVVVLDADALTSFADDPQRLFGLVHSRTILTPHEGEFARLFPDLSLAKRKGRSKIDVTRAAAARAGCVILLKGEDTVIASPDGGAVVHAAAYDRATPWLATAGAGDVLAGLITGLAASPLAPDLIVAAEVAVWLHVQAALKFGPGLIAEDLTETLPAVLRDLSGYSGAVQSS